jgi:RNA recognition motif-containing protein
MRVHISHLSNEVKSEDLRQLIGMHGAIKSIVRSVDRTAGKNDGHVIVEMERREDARKVVDRLNGKEFKGCKLHVAV